MRPLPLPSAHTDALHAIAPWFGDNAATEPARHAARLHGRTSERTLDTHAHLFLEGDRHAHVHIVVSGVVALYKLLSDGRRQVVSFAWPGDIIGLDCTGSEVYSAEALGRTRVRCIPVDVIDRLIRDEPGFGRALLGVAAVELAETRERMLCLGRQSATEKLASFLLRIARRAESCGREITNVQIPMKRGEIADFLGLTIETVSRNFTRLRVARVIRLVGSCEVEILDRERLEAIAAGDDGIRRY